MARRAQVRDEAIIRMRYGVPLLDQVGNNIPIHLMAGDQVLLIGCPKQLEAHVGILGQRCLVKVVAGEHGRLAFEIEGMKDPVPLDQIEGTKIRVWALVPEPATNRHQPLPDSLGID